jgi:hypothetical protein
VTATRLIDFLIRHDIDYRRIFQATCLANHIAVGEDPFPAQPLQASHSSLEATAGAYAGYGWALRQKVSPHGDFRQTDELLAKTNRVLAEISAKQVSLKTMIVTRITNLRTIMIPL